ncbi:MAG TPA: CBS domain-containing protein [Stellaceae bacterium]|jgi:CBS domain-containing protein|nr:CBS domain-containing protein [Stellaceae bacterium]
MRVSELMLRDVTLVPPEDTVQNAARAIADIDSRFILVGVDERVVGILTIRDILIRLVAAGLDPTATPVSQVMSSFLFTCTEEDTAENVAERMAEHRIEQMPVLDEGGRLVGVITRRAAETLLPSSTAQ